MKLLYTQWLALIVTLILNLVGCILLLISGSSEGGWVNFFLSVFKLSLLRSLIGPVYSSLLEAEECLLGEEIADLPQRRYCSFGRLPARHRGIVFRTLVSTDISRFLTDRRQSNGLFLL